MGVKGSFNLGDQLKRPLEISKPILLFQNKKSGAKVSFCSAKFRRKLAQDLRKSAAGQTSDPHKINSCRNAHRAQRYPILRVLAHC
jgi:hypothetical protein